MEMKSLPQNRAWKRGPARSVRCRLSTRFEDVAPKARFSSVVRRDRLRLSANGRHSLSMPREGKTMKRILSAFGLFALAAAVAFWPTPARAQGGFEVVTGEAFVRAVPADFYLEGNRIPVEKPRNAALLKNAKGARVVVALIDTAGYSSQIQQKYVGMLITETGISVCGNKVGVGSYGFGLDRPAPTSNADAKFKLYNQAGEQMGECAAGKDDSIKQPKPLTVEAHKDSPAKLRLGRYTVEIK